MLLVNGIPLVVIEAKTPVRASQSWLDGALQVHDDYERNVPELFVPNVLLVATEGKELRYGSIGLPVELWGPWRSRPTRRRRPCSRSSQAVASMLRPRRRARPPGQLHRLRDRQKKRRIKIIARYQQYEGANKIVERVVAGPPEEGPDLALPGLGQVAADALRRPQAAAAPGAQEPDGDDRGRPIDLDTQISSTFYAADMPNLVKADSRSELQQLLAQDVRKIIITTIYKFGEADGVLNDRDNIIVLVDEAHRTQEGDLGRKMREALPNAFLFGLTGTPINRADRNTFYAFGAEEDERGYLSRYGFEESIRDGATMPLHFEPRLARAAHRPGGDRRGVQGAHRRPRATRTGTSSPRPPRRWPCWSRLPSASAQICADIAEHFQEKVAPNGFGAQVVTFDRESCVLYKQALDEHLPPEASDIVMTVNSGEDEYAAYRRDRDAEEKLLDRFRDPADPLKILIVTVEAAHRLRRADPAGDVPRQAAARPHAAPGHLPHQPPVRRGKTHGLIVDYLGVFDDVAQALAVRRGGRRSRSSPTSTSCVEQLPGGDAEVPGVLPRRRPHRRAATRA